MELNIPRAQVFGRFQEVRLLISCIKQNESVDTPPVDSEEVKILRGLFYVHLYGVFERSLNDAVALFLQSVSSLNLRRKDFSLNFFPVAMNSQFKSLGDDRSKKNWSKRFEFVSAILSDEVCRIENSIFEPHFQSSKISTISEVATYLGMNPDAINASADRYYVDEVVQKRHQVAHGRVSPSALGARGRSPDLELRFEAVSRLIELFMDMLESYFSSLGFVVEEARSRINIVD